MIKKNFLILILAIVALILGLTSHFLHHRSQQQPLESATSLSPPQDVIQFKLEDNHKQNFSNDNFKDHWTFLFFGFTNCPSICPITMAELKKTYDLLKAKNIKLPQIVMITIDPQRDHIDQLNRYVSAFDKDFIGLTGQETIIEKLTASLKILTLRIPGKNKHEYNIDHSGTLLLINPQGKLSAVFTMPHQANLIARDYETILQQN